MSFTYVIISLLVLIAFFLFRKKKSERKRKLPELSFEERYGKLTCAGLDCSANDNCSEAERLFCRNVLSKAMPDCDISAQHIVCLPSGVRKVDFAFMTMDGQKVAIELDGYDAHVSKLSREKFDRQLNRQNELVLSGWQLLRFSFDQCVRGQAYCIDTVKALFGGTGGADEPQTRPLPAVFRDVFYPYVEGQKARNLLKEAGAIFSERRERWYFPEGLEPAVPLPEHWEITSWAVCPECGGKGYERHGIYGQYWSCKDCSKNFNTRQKPSARAESATQVKSA